MHLAIWIFLLMFVTNAAQGYDDERLLERLAEKMDEEGIDTEQQHQQPHQQQQQRGGWRGGIREEGGGRRGGGGRTPASSSGANPPAPHLIPDSVHWKEDDYDSPASSSSIRRGGKGRTPGGISRHSSPPPPPHPHHAVADTDEAWMAAASAPPSSRPQPTHHLLVPSSASSVSDDDSQEQPRRHKTSQRGRLNGSRGLVAHSVCPSQTEWKRLREARDINGTVVEVFQPSHGGGGGQRRQGGRGGGGGGSGGDGMRWTQWFYVVSCRNHVFQSERQCQNCCIGIDHTRYTSSCEQRQSYVMAHIRRPWQKRFSWDYILVNSGCSCAITSTHEDL